MSMRKIHSSLDLSSKLTDSDPLLSLLKDEKKLNKLDSQQFLELITATEETAKFSASSSNICKRLNELPIDDSVQTFDFSCAARCILKMLYDFKLIKKTEFTRARELEIYRQIWVSPGGIANPIKIFQFLAQLGLDVSITEVKNRIKDILPKIPDQMKLTYSFIQNTKELKKKSYEEEVFVPTKDKSFLLIAVCGHGTHFHVIYAKCKDNKFITFSPSSEEPRHTEEFNSFADFFSKNPLFTGMMYTISNPKKLELTEEKHFDMTLRSSSSMRR